MSEVEQDKPNFEALQDLDADSQDLERLEALLDQYRFNIFEVMGFPIRDELRHSAFLAFLMQATRSSWNGRRFREAVFATGTCAIFQNFRACYRN